MVVKYNSLNRLETPVLTLCNPGSVYDNGLLTNVVGVLTDHEAEEIVFNFNSTSELNFRVNRVRRSDPDENEHTFSLYKSLQNRRLIFVEDIGYFAITNIVDGYNDGIQYKDIKAMSVDVEIQQKMIPFIEDGTYRFSNDEDNNVTGIFETIVRSLPLWTIGHVDEAVAERWRTFEDVDTSLNCLGFLLDNIQDAYECIVLFDIKDRIINVYDQANYVKRTSVHLTKDDIINSIDITENADDLYTAIRVLGDEDLSIAAINPTGTNVIYNFNYYLDWMTPGLRAAVQDFQQAIEDEKDGYYEMNLEFYNTLSQVSNLQAEVERLNTQITMYGRCRDNIIADSSTDLVDSYNTVIVNNGGTAIEVYERISDTLDEINTQIALADSMLENVKAQLSELNGDLLSIREDIDFARDALSMPMFFTEGQLEELNNYIFEGSYTDEYVTITDIMSYEEQFEQMKILYDRADFRLSRVSTPTQEFDIDVDNFIFEQKFKHFSDQLETGCLINVELDTDDAALLFLSNITINYDDHSLSMTFGNRFNKFDPKSLFENVLGDISKSANTLGYIKEVLYPIKNGEFDNMKNALQTSRNITMSNAMASSDEEVVIDGSGYTGRKRLDNGSYDPRQVKISGRNIVFTDNAWESCKTALGELFFGDNQTAYGINAEAVIGDLIMGHNLRILDNNGNDLLSVVDGKISMRVDDVDGRVTSLEQTANDISIRVQEIVDNEREVDHVTTSTGYTFGSDGLNISKSGEEMRNTLDHTGMYVTRSGEEVLTANNEGVRAINLTARQYLIVGSNSRFEDYSNGTDTKRTACFYIGG